MKTIKYIIVDPSILNKTAIYLRFTYFNDFLSNQTGKVLIIKVKINFIK